jgi:predicted nucleic acid-binding protein
MAYLFDTNVFLRLARRNDPQRQLALVALRTLRSRKEVLCFTPQVLSEFWNVCTRPASARGGLGLSPTQTERKVRLIERYLRLLPDSLATLLEWRRLVVAHSVMGVQVHDAKLVASMGVYGITHLLTFNVADFKRYSGITVVSPSDVK